MNKINPLFEAMSEVDDNIVSNSIKEECKRPKGLKAILISAAAAVLCAATTITAVASLKAPKNIIVDGVMVEPVYSTISGYGKEWDVYVIDMPDYALGEEKEGKTAVGGIKVVINPEFPGKESEFMMVDEAGNKLYSGVNNKLVLLLSKDGVANFSFACANYRYDTYCYFEWYDESNIGIDNVPYEEEDNYRREHHRPPYLPPLPEN